MRRFIHDAESLPMLDAGGEIFRVQVLNKGRWETLETEDAYESFFGDCEDDK